MEIRKRVLAVFIAAVAGCELSACRNDGEHGSGSDVPTVSDRDVATTDGGNDDANPIDVISDTMPANADAGATDPGSTCRSAIELSPDVAREGERIIATGVSIATCRPSDSAQRFFSFVLPPGQRAIITIAPQGVLRLVARAGTSCDSSQCITDNESNQPGAPVTLRIDSPDGESHTKYIGISPAVGEASGYFAIGVHLEPLVPEPPPEPGSTCANPIPLTAGMALMGQQLPGAGSFTGCLGPEVPQRYYAITVPPHSRATIGARPEPSDAGGQVVVSIRSGCDASSCLSSDITGFYHPAPAAFWNRSDAPVPLIVALTNTSVTATPPNLVVSVSFSPIEDVPPPVNATCAGAVPLPVDGGQPATGTTDLSLATEQAGACGGGASSSSRALYFTLHVPARTVARVLFIGSDNRLRLRDACGDLACVGGASASSDGGPTQFRLSNTRSTDRDYIVEVSSRDANAERWSTLVEYEAPPPNTTCAAATPITTEVVFGDSSFGTGTLSACYPGATGPAVFYSLTVPARTTLVLRTSASSAALIPSCGSTTCLARFDDDVPGSYTNTTTTPQSVILAIGEISGEGGFLGIEHYFQSIEPQIALGDSFACHRHADATLSCWGANASGQLADGTTIDRLVATRVPEWIGVDKIVTGANHACAIYTEHPWFDQSDNPGVFCWGSNTYGQGGFFGDHATTPMSAVNFGFLDIAAGGDATCAILVDRTVWCWGRNLEGELGNGTTINGRGELVVGLTGAQQVAMGARSVCAVVTDGTVRCWGANDWGQVGDGTVATRLEATAVPGLANVAQLAVGGSHACARLGDGTVRCWGSNVSGQLGASSMDVCAGTLGDCSRVPLQVPGLTGVVEIAAGDSHTCARSSDGSIRCWGLDVDGQVGAAATSMCATGSCVRGPVMVRGIGDTAHLALGGASSCALLRDGTAWCWGRNANGQLGDGTTMSRATPGRVSE